MHPVHLRPLARDPDPPRARLHRARRLRRETTTGIRFLKDLDAEIEGRDVILVDDVIDTGLTHALPHALDARSATRRSLHIATLFDRPYRRLVDDLPVRYVGFTIPDEFFVGYGFELDERYRSLPDLRLVRCRILGPAKLSA